MRKIMLAGVLSVALVGSFGCTNMSKTSQGAMSGAAIGAAAGVGIAAISGGSTAWGGIIGSGLGAVAGGFYGKSKQKKRHR